MISWSDLRARERLLALLMVTGVVVSIEPAPFDVGAVALGGLFLLTRQLRLPRTTPVVHLLLALFVATNLVSLVFAQNISRAYVFLAITLYLVALWGLVLTSVGKRPAHVIEAILLGYTVGATIAAATGIAAYLGAPVLKPIMVPGRRLVGLFKDPNVYGAYMAPAAVFAFAQVIRKHGTARALWLVALSLCGAATFLSFSRGAWINLTVGVTTFFLLFSFADGLGKVWWRTIVLLPAAIILLAAVAYQLVSVDAIGEMFEVRFGYQQYDDVRFAIQIEAVRIAFENPLGLGPGSTEGVVSRSAHSLYVRTLVENGLLGALALFTFLAMTVGRAVWIAVYSRALEDRLRFAVVAGALVGALVESTVIDTVHWRHLWILLALAWAPMPNARTRAPNVIRPGHGPISPRNPGRRSPPGDAR
ncbi:MAG: O-antigen ligase family protein [Nannocystaceae bacterium]|nr:O-antigen ligase family protein [bacterium]